MKRLPTVFVVAGFAMAMCGCSGSGPADRVRAGVIERTAGTSLVETREGQQNEILAQYRRAVEEAQEEADNALLIAGLAQTKAVQAQIRADGLLANEETRKDAYEAHLMAGVGQYWAAEAVAKVYDSLANYDARRIGGLLGKTTSQDSFADFPYATSKYPSDYWNPDADSPAGPMEAAQIVSGIDPGIDRGDRWSEFGFGRGKSGEVDEYLTAFSDVEISSCDINPAACAEAKAVDAPQVDTLETGATVEMVETGAEVEDGPQGYVHFGWWLEMPNDIHEDAGWKFATFVDGSDKYSIASLATFASGQANYEGPAAGVFVKRERTTLNTHWSSFIARASLTADFNPSDGGVELEGKITDFVDSGSDTELDGWSLTLHDIRGSGFFDLEREQHFPKQVGYEDDPFYGVKGVADGHELTGAWQGSFYKGPGGVPSGFPPETVAGQFRAFSHTFGEEEPDVTPAMPTHFDDEGFVGLAGAFGAHLKWSAGGN